MSDSSKFTPVSASAFVDATPAPESALEPAPAPAVVVDPPDYESPHVLTGDGPSERHDLLCDIFEWLTNRGYPNAEELTNNIGEFYSIADLRLATETDEAFDRAVENAEMRLEDSYEMAAVENELDAANDLYQMDALTREREEEYSRANLAHPDQVSQTGAPGWLLPEHADCMCCGGKNWDCTACERNGGPCIVCCATNAEEPVSDTDSVSNPEVEPSDTTPGSCFLILDIGEDDREHREYEESMDEYGEAMDQYNSSIASSRNSMREVLGPRVSDEDEDEDGDEDEPWSAFERDAAAFAEAEREAAAAEAAAAVPPPVPAPAAAVGAAAAAPTLTIDVFRNTLLVPEGTPLYQGENTSPSLFVVRCRGPTSGHLFVSQVWPPEGDETLITIKGEAFATLRLDP
jgi:hypothetical protein